MKERITITLNEELLDWIDNKIKKRIFANRSHAFEFLIARLMENNKLQSEDENKR
ncbi:MAG: ribbon-helix-helix domain-containing protein [Candidatus Woesearchaeota archaeon]